MKTTRKKYWILFIIVLCIFFAVLYTPQIGKAALSFSGKSFINFIFMLTPIFICVGLMDVWIEREIIIKLMGEKAGIWGIVIAMLMGTITAVPPYALLPVASVLLKKGSKIVNILIFLGSSTSIRIPLLLFEISSLGVSFTVVRLGLNIIIVLLIAFLIEKTLTERDKKEIYKNADKL